MMNKVGLLVTCYNRPEYLRRCLDSLKQCDLSGVEVVLIDDASTDRETIEILFDSPHPMYRSVVNRGIKHSILKGMNILRQSGCNLFINLDSDAIVKPNFIQRLVELKRQHPDNIVSGFNSLNKDNGKLRNPIISEHEGYSLKQHANGINMCFDWQQYEKYILPALEREGNWDYSSTHDKPFVIAVPSLVQHIGIKSSMGHNNNPDVAADFKLLSLPDITLFGIDCNDPKGITRAADICTNDVEFGAEVIITDKLFEGIQGYSRFCIEEMYKYVETSHVLIIHPDGYIQNPLAWRDEWLQYDYIGATWWYKSGGNVGNGGFSLRSKKLLDILGRLEIEEITPEDDLICRKMRPWLEKEFGIKFAPEEIANQFSIEAYNTPDNHYSGQFGFHGYHVKGLPIPPKPKVTLHHKPARRR